MPIYEYTCTTCEHRFERLRPMDRMDDDAPCPECEGDGERSLSVFVSFSSFDEGGFMPVAGGAADAAGVAQAAAPARLASSLPKLSLPPRKGKVRMGVYRPPPSYERSTI